MKLSFWNETQFNVLMFCIFLNVSNFYLCVLENKQKIKKNYQMCVLENIWETIEWNRKKENKCIIRNVRKLFKYQIIRWLKDN